MSSQYQHHAPRHIAKLDLASHHLRFKDLRVGRRPIDVELHQTVLRCSPRGALALAAAIAEWVLWRVDGHHESDTSALVDAMWAIAVHPSYLAPYDPNAIPPAAHPGWKIPAQSAVWHVQAHHYRIVEQMLGLGEIHDLLAWALHVVPKQFRLTLHEWVREAARFVVDRSPGDPDTFTCITEHRPDPELQRRFIWGRALHRSELDGALLDDAARVTAIDEFLRRLDPSQNPHLCPKNQAATNRRWRCFLDDVPGLQAEPYTFAGD
jgi:hypothetical protein